MQKKSVCTFVEPWPSGKADQYGNVFHTVKFANGDEGNYNTKPANCRFKVGEEAEYNIEDAAFKSGKPYKKITAIKKEGEYQQKSYSGNSSSTSKYKKTPEEQIIITRQVACEEALRMFNCFDQPYQEIFAKSEGIGWNAATPHYDNMKEGTKKTVIRITEEFTEWLITRMTVASDPLVFDENLGKSASNALRRAVDIFCNHEIGLKTVTDILEMALFFFNHYNSEVKLPSTNAIGDRAPF
jgi:hypothetical protein